MLSEVTFPYRDVQVTVYDGPYLVDGNPTEQAIEYYSSLFEQLDALREFAAQEKLEVYNTLWADEDEPPMDQETFVTHLVNPTIVLHGEIDRASVYFQDCDLFLRHWVEIRMEGTTPSEAVLVG
jgi:hypothetical protein